jgi:hypothetical protein
MGNYTYNQTTSEWTWSRPAAADIPTICDLMDQHYSCEIDSIFTPNKTRMQYHLHRSILGMSYGLKDDLISVAKMHGRLVAWSWITRGKYQPYANEEMAVGEFIHVDLALSPRKRVQLVAQVLEQWIAWCELHHIPVLSSTSIRQEQTAFMRLHDQFGFKRNGSFAYRRIGE